MAYILSYDFGRQPYTNGKLHYILTPEGPGQSVESWDWSDLPDSASRTRRDWRTLPVALGATGGVHQVNLELQADL